MEKKYKRSLGWKFSLVLIVTIGLFGISAYIVGHGMNLVRHNIQEKDKIHRQALAISELNSLYTNKEMALQDYFLSGDAQSLEQYEKLSAQT